MCKEFDCLVLKPGSKMTKGYCLLVVDCISVEKNLAVEISHSKSCDISNFFYISKQDGFKQFLSGMHRLA